jgi:3-hydroxyisobutyrate dehydrogenase-like beta-hydroxyacid dehydrogenase
MIGIIGVGAMGGAIAGRLAREFADVMVYDLDDARVKAAVAGGASAARDAASLVQACDQVLVSLPKSAVFVQVAEKTIIPNVRAGQAVVDLGTTVVSQTRRIHGLLKGKGVAFLDAPLSGGPIAAAQGTLFVFVGGDRAEALKLWPLFARIGKGRLTYCGASGAGQIVKAVNQLAMGLVNAAYIETIAYGARAGVDPMVLLSAVGDSSGFRQQFAQIASRIASGEGDLMDNKYAEFEYFLSHADEVGFEAPMLRALYDWMKKFPETGRDNMGRPFPPLWSSLVGGGEEKT